MSKKKYTRDQTPTPNHSQHKSQDSATIESLLRRAANHSLHRRECGVGDHLSEESLLLHLQRELPPQARLQVIRHLAGCDLCLDRLELARELLPLDGLSTNTSPQLELGIRLLEAHLAIDPMATRVLQCDAELLISQMQVRGGRGRGVALRRELADARLGLELMPGEGRQLHLSIELDPAPRNGRVSLVQSGRILKTKPLRNGYALLATTAAGSLALRLEVPGRVLGHAKLLIDIPSHDPREEP